ncbi:M23 family metallopeptidase [Arhodomonas sp. AD133]|uniref:M23 family metallopeptidase n=1 Tax=Arhodomonas sp. AD133 TaxID=3415009 RepID=UPI003EBA18CA
MPARLVALIQMRWRRGCPAVVAAALAMAMTPAAAGTLALEGQPMQGSVLRGHVEPADATVSFAGREVRIDDAGRFIIGFGRDAPMQATVVAEWPDGTRERRELTVGQRGYDIQRIDGLPDRKVTPKDWDLERIKREAALVREARHRDDRRTDYRSGWQWPTQGTITGVYGSQRILNGEPRRPHYGVDIAAPVGTPVNAPADGVVTLTHDDMFFSGGTLLLDHGHGLSSAFLHLSRITVEEGERVNRGDKIAEVGASGRVTGAHLDWRMNWFDRRVDPALLVPPMPSQ